MKTIIALLLLVGVVWAKPPCWFIFEMPKEIDSTQVSEDSLSIYYRGSQIVTVSSSDDECEFKPARIPFREVYKVVNGKIRHVRSDTARVTPAHTVPETVVWP